MQQKANFASLIILLLNTNALYIHSSLIFANLLTENILLKDLSYIFKALFKPPTKKYSCSISLMYSVILINFLFLFII